MLILEVCYEGAYALLLLCVYWCAGFFPLISYAVQSSFIFSVRLAVATAILCILTGPCGGGGSFLTWATRARRKERERKKKCRCVGELMWQISPAADSKKGWVSKMSSLRKKGQLTLWLLAIGGLAGESVVNNYKFNLWNLKLSQLTRKSLRHGPSNCGRRNLLTLSP